MTTKKGIIFDMDGVLIDSMPFHAEAMSRAIKERTNHEINKKSIYLLEGMPRSDLIKEVFRRENIDDKGEVDGEIAKHVTIARRKGDDWFVGTVTNTEKRDLKIPLNFLTPGKKYEASIYYDDPNSKVRTKVSIKRIKVDASTVLDTKLIASGGQAIWIKSLEK